MKRGHKRQAGDEWEVKSTFFNTGFRCLLNISVKCTIGGLLPDSGSRGEVRAGDINLGIIVYICLESHGAREDDIRREGVQREDP